MPAETASPQQSVETLLAAHPEIRVARTDGGYINVRRRFPHNQFYLDHFLTNTTFPDGSPQAVQIEVLYQSHLPYLESESTRITLTHSSNNGQVKIDATNITPGILVPKVIETVNIGLDIFSANAALFPDHNQQIESSVFDQFDPERFRLLCATLDSPYLAGLLNCSSPVANWQYIRQTVSQVIDQRRRSQHQPLYEMSPFGQRKAEKNRRIITLGQILGQLIQFRSNHVLTDKPIQDVVTWNSILYRSANSQIDGTYAYSHDTQTHSITIGDYGNSPTLSNYLNPNRPYLSYNLTETRWQLDLRWGGTTNSEYSVRGNVGSYHDEMLMGILVLLENLRGW